MVRLGDNREGARHLKMQLNAGEHVLQLESSLLATRPVCILRNRIAFM